MGSLLRGKLIAIFLLFLGFCAYGFPVSATLSQCQSLKACY